LTRPGCGLTSNPRSSPAIPNRALRPPPSPGRRISPWGQPGQRLLIDPAVAEIQAALLSPATHQLLQVEEGEAAAPSLELLEAFLRHNIAWSGFNDLVGDLPGIDGRPGDPSLCGAGRGQGRPDVAFTAASTSKIPIMVSVLRRSTEPTPEGVVALFERMIGFSENPPADTLMSSYIDEVRGPLLVTQDMVCLGPGEHLPGGLFLPGRAATAAL
jgi:beta-lactamase class A